MDWSHHSASDRVSNKIYEDSYVSSWGIQTTTENDQITSEKLVSQHFELGKEKARLIDCKNSNRYNITQSIAEAFGVFCQYEYKCNSRGKFKKRYIEDGKVWTGKKVIFYNQAIKNDNPAIIEYKKNLDTIERIKDSSEIYTKLYITPIESSTMSTGYISIADTTLNPTLDDFILNFDYLYQTQAISQYQMNFIRTYEVETHKINQNLINLAPFIEDLTVDINDLKVTKKIAENEISSAQTALQNYETLRDSEVRNTPIYKNVNNPCSIIFYEDGDIKKARLQFYGIEKSSIKSFPNSNYLSNQIIFSGNQLITTEDWISPSAEDQNFYLLTNEYGWPTYIYTSKNNNKLTNSILYLELIYCPKNEYDDICNQLAGRILAKQISVNTLNTSIISFEEELTSYEEEQKQLLEEKEELNNKLEIVLGPALREGYWTPESYEDPGQSKIIESISRNGIEDNVELKFDTIPFENENLNYYYSTIDNQINNLKSYYPYLIIEQDLYNSWKDYKIDSLTLRLRNPYNTYVSDTFIQTGNCFIIYNGNKYYFNLSNNKNQTLELRINENSIPVLKPNRESEKIGTTEEMDNARNITSYFEGQGIYLGERLIYNNAGFIFGFLKEDNIITPIILLNNKDIQYNQYEDIDFIIYNSNNETKINTFTTDQILNQGSSEDEFCYPRIFVYDNNVNYKSDKLHIISYENNLTEENQPLTKYEDYTILTRNGRPCFTLKLTNANNLNNILNYKYRIEYRISRANEMLYLDAKNVAYDNSIPKYSYNLKISTLPEDINFYELGQLIYINDFSVGIHAASGYISKIKLKLNSPQEDELEVKNYKTKFEDLFSTITASSEAMRNNQHIYNIAAGSFNSDGTISGNVLQNSILNNNISMNYSNTNVVIDDTNGIVLTNSNPYLNGVYGQVKLIGGGIFLSNAIDEAGARIWNTGITPNGINAALISAGQLDVNKIRIFAGDNIAFQWNDEGIFAYKKDDGNVDLNTFVRYSDNGLQFISDNRTAVNLGWNGLLISTQDGSTELTGELGLTVYYGEKNEAGNNYAVRLGKFVEDDEYGLRLYKKEGLAYVPTLITSNNGELWLKDYISVGSENQTEDGIIHAAGISGKTDDQIDPLKSVRFWAGSSFALRNSAPFQVLQNGFLYAENVEITGKIIATSGSFTGEIIAALGYIGGWKINTTSLTSGNMTLSSDLVTEENSNPERINVNDKFIVYNDGSFKAIEAEIEGKITATSGKIGGMEINGLISSVQDLSGNTENITAKISSSNGNVTKDSEEFNTIFTVTAYKGNIPFNEDEYQKYFYIWEAKQGNSENWNYWSPIETTIPQLEYSGKILDEIYIRCRLIPVEQGG